MAVFNDTVTLANGTKMNIKIPGGSDNTIYLNGGSNATNYRLGADGCFYNRRSGAQVASQMSVADFAKLHISWILNLVYLYISGFFILNIFFFIATFFQKRTLSTFWFSSHTMIPSK